MAAFGIHVGNTCACLAVFRDDRVDVVANDAGDRVTPSVVSYHKSGVVVGSAAKQEIAQNRKGTVAGAKQFLGCGEAEGSVLFHTRPVVEGDQLYFEVEYNDVKKHVTPKDVLKEIYSQLLDIAQHHGVGDVHDAVITVPKWFNNKQQLDMREAAEAAGFNVLRVISETSAALLAYNIGQEAVNSRSKVLVYRCGGSSSACTLVEVTSGMYTIIDQVSSYQGVAGHHFTKALQMFLAQEFNRKWKCDVSESVRSMMKLEQVSERSKHILSTMATAQCSVESLFDGIDMHVNITRARYESLISHHVKECLLPISGLLSRAHTGVDEVCGVVLVGGGCRVPKLSQAVCALFPDALHHTHLPPDECVAVGAATQASLLCDRDDVSLHDNLQPSVEASPYAISLKFSSPTLPTTTTHVDDVVLHRNSVIPVRYQHHTPVSSIISGTSAHPHHIDVMVEVYEDHDDNRVLLAKLLLSNISVTSMVTTTLHRKSDHLDIVSGEQASSVKQHVSIPCH